MSWSSRDNGVIAFSDIDQAGGELSVHLNCPVRYPAFEKGMFECKCGITFPLFAIKAALASKDWRAVLERHHAV